MALGGEALDLILAYEKIFKMLFKMQYTVIEIRRLKRLQWRRLSAP